jgi:hypothetical protein
MVKQKMFVSAKNEMDEKPVPMIHNTAHLVMSHDNTPEQKMFLVRIDASKDAKLSCGWHGSHPCSDFLCYRNDENLVPVVNLWNKLKSGDKVADEEFKSFFQMLDKARILIKDIHYEDQGDLVKHTASLRFIIDSVLHSLIFENSPIYSAEQTNERMCNCFFKTTSKNRNTFQYHLNEMLKYPTTTVLNYKMFYQLSPNIRTLLKNQHKDWIMKRDTRARVDPAKITTMTLSIMASYNYFFENTTSILEIKLDSLCEYHRIVNILLGPVGDVIDYKSPLNRMVGSFKLYPFDSAICVVNQTIPAKSLIFFEMYILEASAQPIIATIYFQH